MPNQCIAHCLAERFDTGRLHDFLKANYPAAIYREVVHLKREGWDAFVFDYGVVVAWGMAYELSQQLLAQLEPFRVNPLEEPLFDDFTFIEEGTRFRIHHDCIELTSSEVLEKLAISHAIAQSVKLGRFEQQVAQTIETTAHIPERIAREGHTRMSGKELAMMRGRLYLTRSEINLHGDLLDTPEFFWEYPAWQESYSQSVSYLEIRQRVEVLNTRLGVIHELFEMLTDEHNHRHSSRLEWIIIWLIAIEIAIFLFHDIMGLF